MSMEPGGASILKVSEGVQQTTCLPQATTAAQQKLQLLQPFFFFFFESMTTDICVVELGKAVIKLAAMYRLKVI